MKTVLITGSQGFIGKRLASYLNSKYRIVEMNEDINDVSKLEPYFKNIDFVIHLAAKVKKYSPTSASKDFYEVNVLGTLNIARLSAKYNCKLIYFSSISALLFRNDYGISKFLAEGLVKSYTRTYKLKATTVRPCGIIDEDYKDLGGHTVIPEEGKWYPIGRLLEDVENIIENHNFEQGYTVFETKLLIHKYYSIKRRLVKLLKFFKVHA